METLIEIKNEFIDEFATHIKVVSTSNFTHYIIVGIHGNRLPRQSPEAQMHIIKHEKVQRLSKKALQEYHEKGIEEAKRTYSNMI